MHSSTLDYSLQAIITSLLLIRLAIVMSIVCLTSVACDTHALWLNGQTFPRHFGNFLCRDWPEIFCYQIVKKFLEIPSFGAIKSKVAWVILQVFFLCCFVSKHIVLYSQAQYSAVHSDVDLKKNCCRKS